MSVMEKSTGAGMTAPSWQKRLALSAGWVLLLLVVSWRIWGIQFATNDDASMMYLISGAATGQTEPYIYFMGALYSAPLAWLYRLCDAVPWYTLAYMAAMFLSCWMICQTVLKKCAAWGRGGWAIGCAVYGVLYGAFYYTACVRPQFTTIAALCGAAALALLLSAAAEDAKGERWLSRILWAILTLLALNVRYEVGLVTIAVTLCAIGVRILLQKNLSWRRGLCAVLALGVLYGLSAAVTAVYKTDDWKAYEQFNTVRVRFTDYPTAPYGEMESLYVSLGWDQPLYNMVHAWYFLDERVTEPALATIAEANQEWLGQEEQVTGLRLSAFFQANYWPVYLVYGACAAWLLLSLAQAILRRPGAWRTALLAHLPSACFVFGGILLTAFFIWQGRALQRVFDMAFYVSITPWVLLLPAGAPPKSARAARWCTGAASVVLALALLVSAVPQNAERLPDRTEQYAVTDAVEEYCAAHADLLFIKPGSIAVYYRALSVFTLEKPHNLLFWGGSMYASPIYAHQLACNGYQTFSTENLFDENVRFISNGRPTDGMMWYLQSLYPTAAWEVVDVQETFQVYRFAR